MILIGAELNAETEHQPTTGRLPAALGVPPEAVSAVFITHMHADHIGGLVADGRPAFPSAEVFVNRADVAHFTNPARKRDDVIAMHGVRGIWPDDQAAVWHARERLDGSLDHGRSGVSCLRRVDIQLKTIGRMF